MVDIHIFLILGVLNAFVIIGAYIAANETDRAGEGFILTPARLFVERLLGKYWSKPFLGCYKCMASVWGGIPVAGAYLRIHGASINTVAEAIVISSLYTLYLCGLTAIIYSLYMKLNR